MSFAEKYISKLSVNDGTVLQSLLGEKTTFPDFIEKAKKYSKFCEKYPVIATFCTNSAQFLEFVIGSQIAGITLVPLNPSYKSYEIDEYLKISNVTHVVISKDVYSTKFENYEFTILEEIEIDDFDSKISNDIAKNGKIIFFSSGTTGPPKPFFYDSRILLAHIQQFELVQKSDIYYSPSSTDICYGVLPYFHAGGLITVLSMMWIGCTVVINERWNAEEFMMICKQFRVTVLFLVPPVLKFLAVGGNVDLEDLRTIYVGAAAPEKEHFEMVAKRFKNMQNLMQLYGLTECGVLISSTAKGISTGESVGIPFPLVEIKIDTNSQILVKSPTSIIGADDFQETGDLGIIENGELKIIGRSKEMIKIRGWQVNPNELEHFITSLINKDCAVYQNKNGKLVAKIVAEQTDHLRNKVLDSVKNNFASYKALDDVIFCSELPINSSGKLMRRLL